MLAECCELNNYDAHNNVQTHTKKNAPTFQNTQRRHRQLTRHHQQSRTWNFRPLPSSWFIAQILSRLRLATHCWPTHQPRILQMKAHLPRRKPRITIATLDANITSLLFVRISFTCQTKQALLQKYMPRDLTYKPITVRLYHLSSMANILKISCQTI